MNNQSLPDLITDLDSPPTKIDPKLFLIQNLVVMAQNLLQQGPSLDNFVLNMFSNDGMNIRYGVFATSGVIPSGVILEAVTKVQHDVMGQIFEAQARQNESV